MTIKQRILISLSLSFMLVVLAYAFALLDVSFVVWVVLPGIMADLIASGNIHQGFGGVLGAVVTIAVSTLVWFLITFGVLTIVYGVLRQSRKDQSRNNHSSGTPNSAP